MVRILGGHFCPPSARMLYEIFWSDMTSTFEWGNQIITEMGFRELNPTSAKSHAKNMEAVHPHLRAAMLAINILTPAIDNACLYIDGQLSPKEKYRHQVFTQEEPMIVFTIDKDK